MKYKVLKQHFGDKQYWEGEEREVENEHSAAALIAAGLIAAIETSATEPPTGPPEAQTESPIDETAEAVEAVEAVESKAKAAPQNKANQAPKNK